MDNQPEEIERKFNSEGTRTQLATNKFESQIFLKDMFWIILRRHEVFFCSVWHLKTEYWLEVGNKFCSGYTIFATWSYQAAVVTMVTTTKYLVDFEKKSVYFSYQYKGIDFKKFAVYLFERRVVPESAKQFKIDWKAKYERNS